MEPPPLAKIDFITNGKKAVDLWKLCVSEKDKWAKSGVSKQEMADYVKESVLGCIWETNTLEDTLPKGILKEQAFKILSKAYHEEYQDKNEIVHDPIIQQLVNHLQAYQLVQNALKESPSFSEDLVKSAHKVMMDGLKTEEGCLVSAGIYRKIPVHAGQHNYPPHQCIPAEMAQIVHNYETKASQSHDPYQLASWLFYHIVSLHPFEDGNGRLSRLLWCYSLMRDGLPFPAVITSSHRRSMKHLVWCIRHDGRPSVTDNPHLTTLTVASVAKAWKDYFSKSSTKCIIT